MSASAKAKPFQAQTAAWAAKKLSQGRVRRFLVADEVGLGKTIVSKTVIKTLADEKKGRFRVVYICSNLDLAKQNREKLCDQPTEQIVSVDRVTMIYSRAPKNSDLAIYSMTPKTSFALRRDLGCKEERAYLARLAHTIFNLTLDEVTTLFKGNVTKQQAFRGLIIENGGKEKWHMPTILALKELGRRWEYDIRQISLKVLGVELDSPRAFLRRVPDSSSKEAIIALCRALRTSAAIVFLSEFKPDLVILDEFQKFDSLDIKKTDAKGQLSHETARLLLHPETPTLLLSATPYRAFVIENKEGGNETQTEELRDVFRFLSGSQTKADQLVDKISSCTKSLPKLSKASERRYLREKADVENDVLEYMSRTERVSFKSELKPVMATHFLSDKPDLGLTSDNFIEFLLLAPHVPSRRVYLNYWKSGSHPLSYMMKPKRYAVVEDACKNAKQAGTPLEARAELYTKFDDQLNVNLRLRYLLDDVCGEEQYFKYLWLPPTRSYYPGELIYDQSHAKPKKALVFSSWGFVPRQVAAEICSRKEAQFKGISVNNNPLKPSPSNWARFFFPSRKLAGSILSNEDFLQASTYDQLRKLAETRLHKLAIANGLDISTQSGGMTAADFLHLVDLSEHDETVEKLDAIYRRKVRDASVQRKLGLVVPDKFRKQILYPQNVSNRISKSVLRDLAEVAITSPSVCLLRALYALCGSVNDNQWAMVARFSVNHLRHFFNWTSTSQVIQKVMRGRCTYPDQLHRYLRAGNIQAVLDEYMYVCSPSTTDDESFLAFIEKLEIVFSSRRSSLRVPAFRKRQGHAIYTDVAAAFGQGDGEATSRSTMREAFNSPFWPFVLATTSVGQEGLDFHSYCSDIYHWNLPSNPVDYEQREGRINRYQSQGIRRRAIELAGEIPPCKESLWKYVFEQAEVRMTRQDRLTKGMAPNWILNAGSADPLMHRHVLDIPGSADRLRHERLDLEIRLYRLTLGQSDQQRFLEELKRNPFLQKKADVSKYMLNFLPKAAHDSWISSEAERVLKYSQLRQRLKDDVQLMIKREGPVISGKLKAILLRLSNSVQTDTERHMIEDLIRMLHGLEPTASFKAKKLRRTG